MSMAGQGIGGKTDDRKPQRIGQTSPCPCVGTEIEGRVESERKRVTDRRDKERDIEGAEVEKGKRTKEL